MRLAESNPGYWTGRYGKPGPVIVVDSPEAEEEIRYSYPAESARFVRTWEMGTFPNTGKPAGIVEVYTPEAERELRDEYPMSSYRVIRLYNGEPGLMNLGQDEPKRTLIQRETVILGGLVTLAGVALSYYGFVNSDKPWGAMLAGAGASMVGTSVVLLLRDLVR